MSRIVLALLLKAVQERPGYGKSKAAGGPTVIGLGGGGASFKEAQPYRCVRWGGTVPSVALTLPRIQLDYPAATQFPRRFFRHPSSIGKVALNLMLSKLPALQIYDRIVILALVYFLAFAFCHKFHFCKI